MLIAVVSTSESRAAAQASVRSAFAVTPRAAVQVLDLDGSYVPQRDEQVLTDRDVGVGKHEHHVRAILLEPGDLVRWFQQTLVRNALRTDPTVLAVGAGVVLVHDPTELGALADRDEVTLIARVSGSLPADGLWPGPEDLFEAGSYSGSLLAVSRAATGFLDLWAGLAANPRTASDRWLETAASHLPHSTVVGDRFLASPWTTPPASAEDATDGDRSPAGIPVLAVDLSGLDPDAPWLLNANAAGRPRILLSAHPWLAQLTARHAAELRADAPDSPWAAPAPVTSLGTPVDDRLRAVFRAAILDAPDLSIDDLPDPFDPLGAERLASWLVVPVEGGGDLGLGRYLASVYRSRPDLQAAFPGVPGEHVDAFLEWTDRHGRNEAAYSAVLIDLALRVQKPPATRAPVAHRGAAGEPRPGVNVVGYLRAELGVGESARLMVAALTAAGLPHMTATVDRHVESRQAASFDEATAAEPFDTTLLCVNADMTPTIAASVPSLLANRYRIGMWYWEVEDFPMSQHAGFGPVDEVWVATDFVRRAVEPHSPVPVRTITPPLPQPRPTADHSRTRTDLGLPERPYFLFTFDYLSTAERKNPWGLVDAFEAAFTRGEGPLLVIKSINAALRPDQAEHLRLRVAGSPDILLLENYLTAQDRDALVALCAGYVSLHRSEGLGLTMAEAMALGRPVIATGYSGNLQFMTDANSFLVPWTPGVIPARCEPYPPGGVWAEPDLEAAGRMMRAVLDDPAEASRRAGRAAGDLQALHSPHAAGLRISARLAEITAGRRDQAEETRRAKRRDWPREQARALGRRALRG